MGSCVSVAVPLVGVIGLVVVVVPPFFGVKVNVTAPWEMGRVESLACALAVTVTLRGWLAGSSVVPWLMLRLSVGLVKAIFVSAAVIRVVVSAAPSRSVYVYVEGLSAEKFSCLSKRCVEATPQRKC